MTAKKTDDDYKAELTPEQYAVARKKGTERAFTGKYWDCKEDGVYHCVCCGAALFDAKAKYDSGSGWPSFTAPAEGAPVGEERDASLGMTRIEVHCDACQAHLGHVFPDGPGETGLRYCINSASLDLKKR